jgi:hypothetical protein
MWWIIITFLVIISYLIFAKLFIEIDSTVNLYRLSFGGILALSIVFIDDSIRLELKLFWWRKSYNLNNAFTNESKDVVQTSNAKERKVFSLQKIFKNTTAVLKSFKIKKCFITIDTGNMPLNGILFPWVYLLSIYIKKKVSINFSGQNIIILQIENSFARMLWAYFKS